MAKIFLTKHFGSLRPTDEASEEALRKIGQGEVVTCEIRKPRNIKHHRKWWVTMGMIAENFPEEIKPEHISDSIKMELGYTVKWKVNGKEYEKPDSISFERMDQIEFSGFYDKAEKLILLKWLPGITSETLRKEIEELLTFHG